MYKRQLLVPVVLLLLAACHSAPKSLPILGQPTLRETTRDGHAGTDTVYPAIPDFHLLDQDSNHISGASLHNNIYIADFIFLSCPSICPKLTREMKKVYDHYAGDDRVILISHTIDAEHDSIPRLKAYADNLGVLTAHWHFLTGNEDSILDLAEHSYYTMAYPDSTAPGGFAHGGGLLLVDRNRHIRGVYDGTRSEETDRLIKDVQTLLQRSF